jgi:hypothetical protein
LLGADQRITMGHDLQMHKRLRTPVCATEIHVLRIGDVARPDQKGKSPWATSTSV